MTQLPAIHSMPKKSNFSKGDTLVVFGEVFERGYVNGLIDEAKAAGTNVIYTTVGRRDDKNQLRALTADELAAKNQSPLINVPLEAGFDLEPAKNGVTPVDQLKDYGLTGWESAKLDWTSLKESRARGTERFRGYVSQFLKELESHIDPKKNLIFAHTMAGGFPRAKVVMPIANRIFKGSAARYQSSQVFWESEIGRLCDWSFSEVTAQTFHHLIDLSANLRQKISSSGARVRYVAFGYHGNEVLVGKQYEWYSYSPYLQGFAKLQLEEIARKATAADAIATVFNVPEILTNSSSLFLGIEVVLYPLMRALIKENPNSPATLNTLAKCHEKLKIEFTYDDVDRKTQEYLTNPTVRDWPSLEGWPQHNSPEQMEAMRATSTAILDMHKSQKELMTAELSEIVFRACGKIMFHEVWQPGGPVLWIGHEAVARVST